VRLVWGIELTRPAMASFRGLEQQDFGPKEVVVRAPPRGPPRRRRRAARRHIFGDDDGFAAASASLISAVVRC
jgi:hypothetical protein